MKTFYGWLLVAFTGVGVANAADHIDLSTFAGDNTAPRTQVLVLGTVHLSGAPKTFRAEALAPVMDRLAAFKPAIITVEQLPGDVCDQMQHQPALYTPEEVDTYCGDTRAAKAATGLDVAAAMLEMRQLLKAWPEHPSPSQRRHLAAVFLAANDGASALVQWLQLPVEDRRAGDGIDDALAKQLDGFRSHNNESYQIAAPLAARLGLQRVYPVDDHTGDNVDVADGNAYGKAIQHAWDSAADAVKPLNDHEQALWQHNDMLGLYRYINSRDVLLARIRSDFGAAMRDASAEHYGQIYVAGWETRNLRMVGNVRATFRETPGTRVLAIVGSSHKPWFEGLLRQMQNVDVVDAEKVLK